MSLGIKDGKYTHEANYNGNAGKEIIGICKEAGVQNEVRRQECDTRKWHGARTDSGTDAAEQVGEKGSFDPE